MLTNRVIVTCREQEYVIYSPALPYDAGQSWGRATHAFFKIVNDQMVKSEYRLYAINGGNVAEPMELALGLPLHSAWQCLYTELYGSV